MITVFEQTPRLGRSIRHKASRTKQLWATGLACGAILTPRVSFAQNLVINNNTTVTEAAGPVTRGFTTVGSTSGTVGGVPGGTYIVPVGSDVTLFGTAALADLTVALGANSSGLVDVGGTILLANINLANGVDSVGSINVNGGTITTTFGQSQYYLGARGQGTMVVSNGGTESLSQSYLGYLPGSSGILTVEGPGSTYTNGGFFIIGNEGTGELNILDGGVVASSQDGVNGTVIGGGNTGSVLVSGAGSQFSVGAWLSLGVVQPAAAGVLTVTDEGAVDVVGGTFITGDPGASGTLNIGAAAGDPAAVPGTLTTPTITFGNGTARIVFNHTDTSGNYVFAPAITGGSATTSAVDVYSGVTVMTGTSDYFGPTTIHTGPAVIPFSEEALTVASTLVAGAANVLSPNSDYIVQAGGTLDLQGHDQTVLSLTNAGLVRMPPAGGGTPGTVLTTGSYVGQGGTIIMDTFLGTDDSPSDTLVIDGGTATGTTLLHILNIDGPGALTMARGIRVVQEIGGGTITPGAFALDMPEFAGGYGYTLVQEDDGNWYLRSQARGNRTCTQDRTYWQTHSSHGPDPVDPAWAAFENAPFFQSGQTFFDVISTNSSNPYYMLGVQYTTAILNGMAGADLTVVQPTLTQAAMLFAQYTPAEIDALPLDSPVRDQFMQATQTLALYNEGALGPVSCCSCCDGGQCDGGCDGGIDGGSDGGSDGGITMGDPGTGSNGSPGAGGNGSSSSSDSGGCSASSTSHAASDGGAFPLGLGSMLALLLAARARRAKKAA
ncbi:MAG: hypothetical protein FWD73_01815 [Polyangiaceae bacterium]|nr:hypothetical protein [Polyangiaceae bacterium]